MDKSIIEDIAQAEAGAEEIRKRAQAQAQEIVAEAERKAKEFEEETGRRLALEKKRALEEARLRAEEKYSAAIKTCRENAEARSREILSHTQIYVAEIVGRLEQ